MEPSGSNVNPLASWEEGYDFPKPHQAPVNILKSRSSISARPIGHTGRLGVRFRTDKNKRNDCASNRLYFALKFNLKVISYCDKTGFYFTVISKWRGATFLIFSHLFSIDDFIPQGHLWLGRIHRWLMLSMDDAFHWSIKRGETGNRIDQWPQSFTDGDHPRVVCNTHDLRCDIRLGHPLWVFG